MYSAVVARGVVVSIRDRRNRPTAMIARPATGKRL